MKTFLRSAIVLLSIGLFATSFQSQAQDLQFARQNDQRGLNQFETGKKDQPAFESLKVKVGGNFTQQFQALSHSNEASIKLAADNKTDLNKLYPIAPGFNLATANLNIDAQLSDGIRLSLENYMSSRHHQEFWVKGGYIQIDKLSMFNNTDWFDKNFSVKVGHMEINYGDQHFRRTDNGRSIFNPLVGNTIVDAFTTEIGAEVYYYNPSGLFGMVGLTNGLINGDVKEPATGVKKSPSVLAKVGFDKQLNEDFRVRLTGSVYNNSNTVRNTLYGGDRTGSRYYFAMEPEYYVASGVLTATATTNRFTSGRLDPGFTNQITAIMINPFVKWKGLEFFGTYETSKGKTTAEATERKMSQMSAELSYRFLPREQVFVTGRYTAVTARLAGFNDDISINRIQVGAGWYVTKNLMVKAEYVSQQYVDFPQTDYRYNGEFNGIVVEAAVGF